MSSFNEQQHAGGISARSAATDSQFKAQGHDQTARMIGVANIQQSKASILSQSSLKGATTVKYLAASQDYGHAADPPTAYAAASGNFIHSFNKFRDVQPSFNMTNSASFKSNFWHETLDKKSRQRMTYFLGRFELPATKSWRGLPWLSHVHRRMLSVDHRVYFCPWTTATAFRRAGVIL